MFISTFFAVIGCATISYGLLLWVEKWNHVPKKQRKYNANKKEAA